MSHRFIFQIPVTPNLGRNDIENGRRSCVEAAIWGRVISLANDLFQHWKPSSRDDAVEMGRPQLLPFCLVHTALEIAALVANGANYAGMNL